MFQEQEIVPVSETEVGTMVARDPGDGDVALPLAADEAVCP